MKDPNPKHLYENFVYDFLFDGIHCTGQLH